MDAMTKENVGLDRKERTETEKLNQIESNQIQMKFLDSDVRNR